MGIVFWFTGLSGAGKTTLAEGLEDALRAKDKSVSLLDGDVVRATLHKNLGFSREDIRENNRLIAELAREKRASHDVVLVPIISPYREDRDMARRIVGEGFFEVFIDCPLSICEARDVKGLYKKARSGEIENFIGISELNPYERPIRPDILIETDKLTEEQNIRKLLEGLGARGMDLM